MSRGSGKHGILVGRLVPPFTFRLSGEQQNVVALWNESELAAEADFHRAPPGEQQQSGHHSPVIGRLELPKCALNEFVGVDRPKREMSIKYVTTIDGAVVGDVASKAVKVLERRMFVSEGAASRRAISVTT
jgi:hypothetical protein